MTLSPPVHPIVSLDVVPFPMYADLGSLVRHKAGENPSQTSSALDVEVPLPRRYPPLSMIS